MSDDVHRENTFVAHLTAAFPCTARYEYHVRMLYSLHSRAELNRYVVNVIIQSIRKSYTKEQWTESKNMFSAVFVYIMMQKTSVKELHTDNDLSNRYNEFHSVRLIAERTSLLQFRNVLAIAQKVLDPLRSKRDFFHMVGRICGGTYIPGSAQNNETERRVLIFEKETGFPFRKQQVESTANRDAAAAVRHLTAHLAHLAPQAALQAMSAPQDSESSDDLESGSESETSFGVITEEEQQNQEVVMTEQASTVTVTEEKKDMAHIHAALLKEKQSDIQAFWRYRLRMMRSGQDIPFVLVPAPQAHLAYAYPSHDWGTPHAPHMPHPQAMHQSQYEPHTSHMPTHRQQSQQPRYQAPNASQYTQQHQPQPQHDPRYRRAQPRRTHLDNWVYPLSSPQPPPRPLPPPPQGMYSQTTAPSHALPHAYTAPNYELQYQQQSWC